MHWQGSRRRAALLVVAVVVALAIAGTVSAGAQLTGVPGQESTSTTAAPTPEPEPAPEPQPEPQPQPEPEQSTTTTQPDPPLSVTPGSSTTTSTPPPSDEPTPGDETGPALQGEGDAEMAPDASAGPFPPELQALTNSVRRSGANNTRALLKALEPLAEFGLDPTQRALVGFGRFPVAGETTWIHDWWFPRFGPGWRLHQGIDLFAPFGTPVRAPVDGRIRVSNGGLGGIAVYVVQPDRTYWYLAHLSGIAPGIVEGVEVKTGQVVGFVGASGNARGGTAHVHMEIHPGGGGPIDPKPIVDKFVADALAMAPQLVDAYRRANRSGGPVNAPAPAPPEPVLTSPLPPKAALLWASAVNPAGGSVRLAAAEALDAADLVDWDRVGPAWAELAEDRAKARREVQLLLGPLVPAPLRIALYPTD